MKIRPYLDNEQNKLDNLEIMITAQLVINEQPIQPIKYNSFDRKMLIDQEIAFNYRYKDLSYNSLIAITIWCTNKNRDEKRPLGSTTISLFDEDLKLREGKLNLYIWPNTLPDYSFDSKTPGLVQDKNMQDINFAHQKLQYYENNNENHNHIDNISLNQLRLFLLYTYSKIPAAFLEIEFPKFRLPIFYEDLEFSLEDASQ